MGYLGDILDRNKAMTLTLSIACLAAISSAVLPRGSPTSVYIIIIICRFILGAGLGGVYPLSAAKAAEDAPPDEQEKENNSERNNHDLCSNKSDSDLSRIASSAETSVTFIPVSKLKAGTKRSAMAFFWQIPGSMTPWALAYLFSFLDLPVDTQWRLLLGLGSIPAAFVVVLLVFEMKNTYRHQKIKISNTEREAPGSLAKSRSALTSDELAAVFHNAFRSKIIWFKVLYTGGGWFLFDVCFCK